jgi:uncharacterized membrane protein
MKKIFLITIALLFLTVGFLEVINILILDRLQNIIKFILVSIFIGYLTINNKYFKNI